MSSKVLGELADLRAQMEAYQYHSVTKTQQLQVAEQEIAALKAELVLKVPPDPGGRH